MGWSVVLCGSQGLACVIKLGISCLRPSFLDVFAVDSGRAGRPRVLVLQQLVFMADPVLLIFGWHLSYCFRVPGKGRISASHG
jgi:hypothetical protein